MPLTDRPTKDLGQDCTVGNLSVRDGADLQGQQLAVTVPGTINQHVLYQAANRLGPSSLVSENPAAFELAIGAGSQPSSAFFTAHMVPQAAVAFASIITPAQITANQDNYSAGGAMNAAVMAFLNSDAARNISGIDCTVDGIVRPGRLLWVVNVGAFNITLLNMSGSSSTNNQMRLRGNANVILAPMNGVTLVWPVQASGPWRQIGTM